jgi:crotonobetainyl-CoA:carnitine CoA-transferase CaiB-like acyl-CoA transferase
LSAPALDARWRAKAVAHAVWHYLGGAMSKEPSRPLTGLKVVDLGVGMAAALASKLLAELGAEVRRLEPAGGDPFYAVYPAYRAWRSRALSVEETSGVREDELLADADICILGGEDFPALPRRSDAEALLARFPRLVALEIAATLPDAEGAPLHGADILAQARSGLVFESCRDRPAVMGFEPSAYGAALLGLIGVGAALYLRQGSGKGQVVRAGLLEGALVWGAAYFGRAENPSPRYRFSVPRGARPLAFRMADGAFVHVVLGSRGAKYQLYKILGVDDPSIEPNDPGLPNLADPENFFGDLDLLAPYAAAWTADAFLQALAAAGVVAERVCSPGECWSDEQVGFCDIIDRSAQGEQFVGRPILWTSSAGAKTLPPSAAPSAPLAGVRVLDFGVFVAGPGVSAGLADLGAEVIKVEPPSGDPLRASYTFYAAANRGKRSIVIEMKSEAGLALAHRLAQEADIVCSNFRTGVAERLGIDAATLHARQPGKIVITNAGFGQTGPKASQPAFDPCMQALCGHEVRAGGAGNPPQLNRFLMIDFAGALLGQLGAVLALYGRARDGSGAEVVVPLLSAGIFLLSDIVRNAQGGLEGPLSLPADQLGYHPAERLYRAADQWVAVAARGDQAAARFAAALELAEVAATPRASWGPREAQAIAERFAGREATAILDLLMRAEVPAELCREGWAEFIGDDRMVALGRVFEAERGPLGLTRGLGRLFELQSHSPRPSGDLAELAQHGRSIMSELGLDEEEIERLVSSGAVLAPTA